jgi:acetylxylan esterase
MYEYVPAKLAASPPIVVAAHYCGGSAAAFFGFTGMPAIEAAADKYGFVMIFAQTTNPATSAKCWDVGSKASLTHGGGGDTEAIAQMVEYEIGKRNANAARVYMMGASSGAMLTEAMLAVYPDVFKAGAEFSGVPAGCWSDGWSAASNWGGTCANGQDSMTAEQWGALVRGMYPGYSGYRPRIQLWHGTSDATINYNNQKEAIKEWTNVLDLSATPNSTDTTSTPGFTIEKWQNTCGFTVLEAHTQANGGHTTPIDANSVVSFFGLDKNEPDPQVAACGGGENGGSGGAGAGGSAGVSSANGGAPSNGGSGANGGSPSGGGTTGGGESGGTIGSSGGRLGGSAAGTGGSGGALGNPGIAGAVSSSAGSLGNDASSPDSADNAGCSCEVATGRGPAGSLSALALAALGAAFGRRARRRRTARHEIARR